jgi:hypothetical protein
MRKLAGRFIARVEGENGSVTITPAAFLLPEKLRLHLVTLMGIGGFHALLSRALALAGKEVPWLSAVQARPDGSLGGLKDISTPPGPEDYLEGRVVLLAQMFGLLVAFVGEELTLRLLREVWPKISLNDLSPPSLKGKNEKDN